MKNINNADFVINDGVLTKYVGNGGDVVIPDGVTSIGAKAFYECSEVTSITFPNTVTDIGDYAFYRCTSITNLVIPSSVKRIGDYAFAECTSLQTVKMGG